MADIRAGQAWTKWNDPHGLKNAIRIMEVSTSRQKLKVRYEEDSRIVELDLLPFRLGEYIRLD